MAVTQYLVLGWRPVNVRRIWKRELVTEVPSTPCKLLSTVLADE